MLYRIHAEKARFIMAAGVALSCGVGLAAALPMPAVEPLYALTVLASDGNAYVTDYGLTLPDCVGRWADYPATVGLECNPETER